MRAGGVEDKRRRRVLVPPPQLLVDEHTLYTTLSVATEGIEVGKLDTSFQNLADQRHLVSSAWLESVRGELEGTPGHRKLLTILSGPIVDPGTFGPHIANKSGHSAF